MHLRESKIQNFFGGACPQTPLALHVLRTCTNQKLLNISRIAQGNCKTWTLDSGLDCGLDYGLTPDDHYRFMGGGGTVEVS